MSTKKGWKKQRLWTRVERVQAEKKNVVLLDLPVTPETTIKDFQDLEELLNNMFDGATFEVTHHWEPLATEDPDVVAFNRAMSRGPFRKGETYEVTYLPLNAKKRTKKFVATFLGEQPDDGDVRYDFSGRPEYGSVSIYKKQLRGYRTSPELKPRAPR